MATRNHFDDTKKTGAVHLLVALMWSLSSIHLVELALGGPSAVAFAKSGPGIDGQGGSGEEGDSGDDGDDGDDSSSPGGRGGKDNSGPGNSDDLDRDDDDDDDHDDAERSVSGNSKKSGGKKRSDDGEKHSRSSGARSIEITSSGVSVSFNDGARSEIRSGLYRYFSSSGRLEHQRAAKGADIAVMRSIARTLSRAGATAKKRGTARVTKVVNFSIGLRVEYSNGWKEEVRSGRYVLTDPYSRRVISRPVMRQDMARLQKYAR